MILMNSSEINFDLLSIPEVWYNFTVIADRWVPVIVVGSFLIGFLIKELFRKTRDIQKWATDTLMIKVPIVTIVAVPVYGALYKLLNLM